MPKDIRFAELVKKSGKPETVTLWTKPEDNPSLMKAVRENRVLTVKHKPTEKHKDFGQIGFHQEPSALYLVFAKPLPKATDARVIGIKYDLVEEPVAKKAVSKKELKAPKILPKPKPVEKKFSVTVRRTATVETKLIVTATKISDAQEQALKILKQTKFEAGQVEDEVKSVTEV
jgi:hypothetical protein